MPKFNIVIERVEKEQYEMELETGSAMEALDQARALVASRNSRSTLGAFSVIKVISKEEDHV